MTPSARRHRQDISKIGLSRALRLIRIVRLTRIVSRTRRFRELHKLIRMMATCLKALLWSFVFCFVCMTVWAMLIVEVINPLVQETRNLLLFKTVIAGDSWGELAVPVIKEYPSTAIIFMGSLLTLVFGRIDLLARGLDHLLAQDGLFDEDEPLHPLHLEESGGSVEKHAEAVPVQQDGIVEEPNASKSSLSSLLAAHKVTSSKQLQPDMSVELKDRSQSVTCVCEEPPPSPIASNGGSKEGPRATSSPLMPPLGEALEGLEAVVAKATEQALKRCMAMMEAPKRFGGFGAGLTSMNLELRPFSREATGTRRQSFGLLAVKTHAT
eukprot:g14062.t1